MWWQHIYGDFWEKEPSRFNRRVLTAFWSYLNPDTHYYSNWLNACNVLGMFLCNRTQQLSHIHKHAQQHTKTTKNRHSKQDHMFEFNLNKMKRNRQLIHQETQTYHSKQIHQLTVVRSVSLKLRLRSETSDWKPLGVTPSAMEWHADNEVGWQFSHLQIIHVCTTTYISNTTT